MLFKRKAAVFVDKEKMEHIISVCKKISETDDKFKFDVAGNVIILIGSKDDVHKKAMWLVKKVDGVKSYQVI